MHTFYDFLESVFGQAMLRELLPELVQLLPEASHRAKLLLRAGMLKSSKSYSWIAVQAPHSQRSPCSTTHEFRPQQRDHDAANATVARA